jgi:hypothetical protein
LKEAGIDLGVDIFDEIYNESNRDSRIKPTLTSILSLKIKYLI